jgi:hypothetical protein
MIEQLVGDLYRSVVTHLGRVEARRLFEAVAKEPWKGGRQPDRKKNEELLARYDRELAKHPQKRREIPRRVGQQCHPRDPLSAEAVERRVRRLVSDRSRRQKAMEEHYRWLGPTPLLESTDI